MLGEVLGDNAGYMFSEAHLDSITDYPGFKGLWSSFNSLNMFEMAHTIKRNYGEMYRGQTLFSFVDNHDVERIASKLTDLENYHLFMVCYFLYQEYHVSIMEVNGDKPERKNRKVMIL